MIEKEVRSWKKVHESDLSYISIELKDLIEPPALIILDGDLGSGKTTFIKTFVGDSSVNSPSYSVVNEFKDIVHADFYRLEKEEEIVHLELPLYLENKNFFIVEWGRKFINCLYKEIPEDFYIYIFKISVNEMAENQEVASRNFTLFSVKDL